MFAVKTTTGAKLHVVEIDHKPTNLRFTKETVDIYFSSKTVNNFSVAMQISQKYNIIYFDSIGKQYKP